MRWRHRPTPAGGRPFKGRSRAAAAGSMGMQGRVVPPAPPAASGSMGLRGSTTPPLAIVGSMGMRSTAGARARVEGSMGLWSRAGVLVRATGSMGTRSAAMPRARVEGAMGLRSTAAATTLGRWSNGYEYRFTIVLPAVAGAPDVERYPFFDIATRAELRSVANGGLVQSALGWDIRYELPDGTKLDHDLLRYDPATGALAAMVNLPLRRLGQQGILHRYVGRAGLGAGEATGAAAWRSPSGTWLAAWLLDANTDRTGNNRTLTRTAITATTLGGLPAGDFNGSTSEAVAAGSGWLNGATAATLLALYSADTAAAERGIVGSYGTERDFSLWGWPGAPNGANAICGMLNTSGGKRRIDGPAGSYRTGLQAAAWGARQGEVPALALDGEVVTPAAPPGALEQPALVPGQVTIGRVDPPGSPLGRWDGKIALVAIAPFRYPDAALAAISLNLAEPRLAYGEGAPDRAVEANASPVALPVYGAATAGQQALFDPAASAHDPGDTATLDAVGSPQPAQGTAVMTGGRVGYTANPDYQGKDMIGATVRDVGGKRSSSVIRVTVTGSGGGEGEEYPAPSRPARVVSNRGELDDALSSLQAGDHIILRNGDYGGSTLTLNQGVGTAAAPVVIRAESKLGSHLTFRILLGSTARHIRLWGLDLTSSANIGDDAIIDIKGQYIHVIRCKLFRKAGQGIQMAGKNCLIIRNDISIYGKSDINDLNSGKFSGIGCANPPDNGFNEIAWNYVHDMPFKSDTYTQFAVTAIGCGDNPMDGYRQTRWHVHHNMLWNNGIGEVHFKTSLNRCEDNTIDGVSGKNKCYFNQRSGSYNIWLRNYSAHTDYNDSFSIHGGYHVYGGNYGVKGYACKWGNYDWDDDTPAEMPRDPRRPRCYHPYFWKNRGGSILWGFRYGSDRDTDNHRPTNARFYQQTSGAGYSGVTKPSSDAGSGEANLSFGWHQDASHTPPGGLADVLSKDPGAAARIPVPALRQGAGDRVGPNS